MAQKKRVLVRIILICITAAILYILFASENTLKDGKKTALIINGEKVSADEVKRVYMTIQNGSMPEEKALEEALNAVINYHLILQDASERGIRAEDDEVENAMEMMAESNGMSGKEFPEFLKRSGIDEDEFREKLREEIIVRKTMAQVLAEKSQVGKKWNLTGEEYAIVRQIYLSRNDYPGEELLKTANNISDRIKAGESICDIAKEYGQNCTQYLIGRGTTFKKYEEAAFRQKPGETAIVTSGAGVHFVETVAKIFYPGSAASVGQGKSGKLYEDYIRALRNNAEIKSTYDNKDIFLHK